MIDLEHYRFEGLKYVLPTVPLLGAVVTIIMLSIYKRSDSIESGSKTNQSKELNASATGLNPSAIGLEGSETMLGTDI